MISLRTAARGVVAGLLMCCLSSGLAVVCGWSSSLSPVLALLASPALLSSMPPLILVVFVLTGGAVAHSPTEIMREGVGQVPDGHCTAVLFSQLIANLMFVGGVHAVVGQEAAAKHFHLPQAASDDMSVFLMEAGSSLVFGLVMCILCAGFRRNRPLSFLLSILTCVIPYYARSFNSIMCPMHAAALSIFLHTPGWPTRVLAPLLGASAGATILSIRRDPHTPSFIPACRFFLRKLRMFVLGIAHLILSKDKSWSKSKLPDPDWIKGRPGKTVVRIMFIRHGESEWNQVFNKGFGPSFLFRLVRAILLEITMLVTPDSLFIDSPLSQEGREQAEELGRYLDSYKPTNAIADEAVAQLRGQGGQCVLVSSTLRRAIATLTIALWSRLRRHSQREQILIHTSLQEISRNIDTLALTPQGSRPFLPMLADMYGDMYKAEELFDISCARGNKKLRGNGYTRMMEFAAWTSKQPAGTVIIVGGHSLWFRHFLQTFLPASCTHPCKTKKMVNCGVFAFNFERALHEGKTVYRIDPDSLTNVRGGFTAR